MKWLSVVLACACSALALQAQQHKVVMISIDGLRGVELASLPNAQWNLPNLNEIVAKGAVAEGMLSVFPSVTYPNHTSLVTGDSPATHGIQNNFLFDPEHRLAPAEGWYEYSSLINVPTLWTVAHDAGLRTAGVYWPVTVGATLDANFPEHYPMLNERDRLLYQALCTPGLLAKYEQANGKLPLGQTAGDALGEAFDDHVRAKMAAFLIETQKPDFTLVHFIALDHAEHMSGPDSPDAIRALESIDGYIGMLRKSLVTAGLSNQTDLVIVSDHGFFPVAQSFHPDAVLASLGLLGTKEHPEKWRVAPFGGGGSFGLVVHDPNDHEAMALAAETFKRLQREGTWGIDQILEGDKLKETKGFSNSFMAVGMKSGFWGDAGDSGPWLTPSRLKGMHGYVPGDRNMDASFAVMGPGIAHARLPRGHVVDVAPTVAALLRLKMGNVEGANLLSSK